MNDGLRLAAVASQLLGFIIIFLMRTYEVASLWQGVVLALMLLSAFLIWIRRHYERNKKLMQQQNKNTPE